MAEQIKQIHPNYLLIFKVGALIVNFLLLSYKLNKKVLKPITIDISGIIYIF